MSSISLSLLDTYMAKLNTTCEVAVTQFVMTKTNSDGLIWWPKEKIARYVNCSVRTVQNVYRKLMSLGIIRKSGLYKGKTRRIPIYEVLNRNGERCSNSNPATDDTITPKELYIEKKEKRGASIQEQPKSDTNNLSASTPINSSWQKENKNPWSEEAENIFNKKFKGRLVTISEMFAKCAIYRARKDGSVSDRDFQKWIIGTDIGKYKIKSYETRSTVKEFQIIGTYSDVDREISAKARLPWISSMRSMLGL